MSVFAKTVYQLAYSPLVMKHLEPLMTHLSPFLVAVVFIPETATVGNALQLSLKTHNKLLVVVDPSQNHASLYEHRR